MIGFLQRALKYSNREAIIFPRDSPKGSTSISGFDSISYETLVAGSIGIASQLKDVIHERIPELHSFEFRKDRPYSNGCRGRVAIIAENKPESVAALWGTWLCDAAAVPLSPLQKPQWDYFLQDAEVSAVITPSVYIPHLESILGKESKKDPKVPIVSMPSTDKLLSSRLFPIDKHDVVAEMEKPLNQHSLMIYTSGTTGHPKGVVITNDNLVNQVTCLETAWEWTERDFILQPGLPLHHVHGLVNVVCCAMWSGARMLMMPQFNAPKVWDNLISWTRQTDSHPERNLSLFMAVPTMYCKAKLVSAFDEFDVEKRKEAHESCKQLRAFVSGSMALPVSVLEKWRQISGHIILERYGMSEIGMALSQSLHGERIPGQVGFPLPGVDARIMVKNDGTGERLAEEGEAGELRIRGPNVFKGYWKREESFAESFDGDGFFLTGDVAECVAGNYKILGRQSVDILKVGGYKISALEVERMLLEHPKIESCAVLGIDDKEYGQKIGVVATLKKGEVSLTLEELTLWGKQNLPKYKIPSSLLVMKEMPVNAMGKVNKKELAKLFQKVAVTTAL